jgi:hypothetical protein
MYVMYVVCGYIPNIHHAPANLEANHSEKFGSGQLPVKRMYRRGLTSYKKSSA